MNGVEVSGANFDAAIQIFTFTVGLGVLGGLLLSSIVFVGRAKQAKAMAATIEALERENGQG